MDLSKYEVDALTLAIVFTIAVLSVAVSQTLRWALGAYFERASDKLKVDPTRYKFFRHAVSLIVYFLGVLAIVYSVPKLRNLALTVFASAGVFLAILGFAAQHAFANIVSGVFIVVFRPFRVGDMIRIGELHAGTVEDITLRHTVITDFQNRRIIIPNSVISSETVVNSSIDDSRICEFVEFGISYDSDVDKAIDILRNQAMTHDSSIDNRTEEEKSNGVPMVKVNVVGYGDSSVNLRAYVWSTDPFVARQMHFDLNKSVKAAFDRHGIEIPFPYRTIVYKDQKTPSS